MEQPPKGSIETAALATVREHQQRGRHPAVLGSGTYKNAIIELQCGKCSEK